MAKQVYTYIIVGLGMILLLAMAGIDVGANSLLTFFGIEDGFKIGTLTLSSFYIKVAAIFALAAVGGFGIGFLSNRGVESFIVGSMAGVIFGIFTPIFWNITQLVQTYNDWTGYLLFLIMIPYMAGFAIALVDYWRGSD